MREQPHTTNHGHQAESPAQMPALAWKDIAKRTWRRTWQDNVGLVAAGVTYYGFLAFVPLLGIIVMFYGTFAEPETVVVNVRAITTILPPDVAMLIADQLIAAVKVTRETSGLGVVVALLVALYGGTNGASAIITALNIAYEEKEKRSLGRYYLVAALMTVAAVILSVAALAATTTLAFLGNFAPGASPVLVLAAKIAGYGLLTMAGAAVAATLYRFTPSREHARWVWITPGSLFAAVTWLLLTLLFSFYATSITDYETTYGSLGTIIVLLTWIYLSAFFSPASLIRADCSFSNARTSIWRIRSRLTSIDLAQLLERLGVVGQPPLGQDVLLAVVEALHRVDQQFVTDTALLGLGDALVLERPGVDKKVLPLALAAFVALQETLSDVSPPIAIRRFIEMTSSSVTPRSVAILATSAGFRSPSSNASIWFFIRRRLKNSFFWAAVVPILTRLHERRMNSWIDALIHHIA
jgi:membrane protein